LRPSLHSGCVQPASRNSPGVRHVPTKKGFRIVGKANKTSSFSTWTSRSKFRRKATPNSDHSNRRKESALPWRRSGGRNQTAYPGSAQLHLEIEPALRVRGIIARGEIPAELGRYYDAVQQYQRALDLERTMLWRNSAWVRRFFLSKELRRVSQSFRDGARGQHGPHYPVTEVWSHIYLGRIYDITNDARARSTNTARPSKLGRYRGAQPKRKSP